MLTIHSPHPHTLHEGSKISSEPFFLHTHVRTDIVVVEEAPVIILLNEISNLNFNLKLQILNPKFR